MIVIPMAGMSSRFFKAGYNVPKYMLEAHGLSLFAHCINSFHHYFSSTHFLFIVRDVYETPTFVENECKKLGIASFDVQVLSTPTQGQAETVHIGINNYKDSEPVTIFNIDTIRLDFEYPKLSSETVGYLEIFKGSGDNWSFVEEDSQKPGHVTRTTEKQPISELCSNGLYHFKSKHVFNLAYDLMSKDSEDGMTNGELYVAPMYNYLLKLGYTIEFVEVPTNKIIFSGIPEEYEAFKRLDLS